MIPVRGHEGQRVAVLGLGRSGLSAARALRAGGAEPVVWDDGAEARARAEAEGFDPVDLNRAGALEGSAALIVSPGIPHLYPKPNPVIAAAWDAGVPVDNDIGLFFRSLATPEWDRMERTPKVVAITGSNGKSTTSALIHHILTESGRPAQLAGNIGRGVLDLDPPGEGGVVVLELSSYQTDLARALTPDVAVFTNLSPDHLGRHGGMGGYFWAKRRLFSEGGPDRAVIGVDEDEGRFLANTLAEGIADDRVIRVSARRKLKEGWGVWAAKGQLAEWRRGRQVAHADLRGARSLPGAHNHQNACAAWGACRALGLGPQQIAPALESFPGLPHRSQLVAEIGGVAFVNDSKATNADAAAQALRAFPRIRWIAGGLGKEGGIESLAGELGAVVKAYLIGHSARAFALQLPAAVEREIFETVELAVRRAAEEAEAGDTVLLAPAAASFDQFADFEKRGEAFVAAVETVPAFASAQSRPFRAP